MRIAPVLGVLRVPAPLVADPDAAGEADVAVDDQQLAMGAVVHAIEVVPAQGMELAHLHPGVAHLLELLLLHLVAADPVQQDVDLDAGAGPLGQGLGEVVADLARPVDVGLEIDGVLRAADRLEHRGEDLVPVLQRREAVAADDVGAEQHAHRALELGIVDPVGVAQVLAEVLLAAVEVGGDQREHGRSADAEQHQAPMLAYHRLEFPHVFFRGANRPHS